MKADSCCQFTPLSVPFSVHRCWFIVFCVCVCVCVIRLLFIDTEFRTLKLKAEDFSGRQHILTIKLKSKVRHTFSVLAETHTRSHTCSLLWVLFTLKITYHQLENSSIWCWPTANPNWNRPTPPNAYWMFNMLIANLWFTSAPLNLGQTGAGVGRHDNPLWLRCSTDKISPHRPQRAGKPSSMHKEK